MLDALRKSERSPPFASEATRLCYIRLDDIVFYSWDFVPKPLLQKLLVADAGLQRPLHGQDRFPDRLQQAVPTFVGWLA